MYQDSLWVNARKKNRRRFPHQYEGRRETSYRLSLGHFIAMGHVEDRPSATDPKVTVKVVVNQPPHIATVVYQGKKYRGRNALKRMVRAQQKPPQKTQPVPAGLAEKHTGARAEAREAMLLKRRRDKRHKRRAEEREIAELRASL